jgi:hypothetical protein
MEWNGSEAWASEYSECLRGHGRSVHGMERVRSVSIRVLRVFARAREIRAWNGTGPKRGHPSTQSVCEGSEHEI